ncbi:MAG: two-component system sensor histidine kinase FlrB [Halioglobus sp.]|jgi:two-component system sensor histidine kinase FlrB
MSQMETMSADELGQAFDVFNRVSHELDTSYRELESQVAGLTRELTSARSARLLELAEKERLAHRLSSLISVLPGGVLIVDASQSIRDANPEALELLGEPLIGFSWGEVLSRVAGIKKLSSRELELNNGKRVSVVSRLLGRTGDHVVLITDVSEIHQLQEQLGHKKRLIAMGEMAARVAHQIRTPLSSATLYLAQLARQDMAAEQRKKIVLKVSDRLNQMGNLVDSMLSFVRGETPTTEVVSLREVMLNFESAILPQMEKSGSRVSIPRLDDTLMIRGDSEELVGCLSNLAMNALESSDGKVLLDLWVGALNSQWLQIKVRDNGPGISEDIMDRIFDPFFTTRALGTGLGLAVVAMTISDHGGEISVKNHPGGGAEFLITLPLLQSTEVDSSSDSNE